MNSSALTCACWQPIKLSALGVSEVPGWRMDAPPCHGCFQATAQGATCLITYMSLETLSLVCYSRETSLLYGTLMELSNCLKGWHCLVCAVVLVETLTGPGKWMTVGSGFVFKHLITRVLWAAPSANRSTAVMLSPFQQVHGMKGAWHLSGEETPAPVELPTMSRTLLAGRMQPEIRSICVFLPTREQLSLAVGVSGWEVAASRPLFRFVSSHCSPKSLVLVCWPKGY